MYFHVVNLAQFMYKVAVVGASGMVGTEIRRVLDNRRFPINEFIPVASEKSVGKSIEFSGKLYKVVGIEEALDQKPQFALFSAGADVSLKWAERFAEIGCVVVDNSSAWRMNEHIKLVVPEINGHVLKADDRIIANPNCSTIQLVMVLAPLHKAYGIKRVLVSTYQSITGTGYKAVEQLFTERKGEKPVQPAYFHPIDLNLIPQCDVFLENAYTKEEMKLTRETIKILGDTSILVSATAVRVPVMGGHSESVNIEFAKEFELSHIQHLLKNTSGVIVQDDPDTGLYPMPLFAQGQDDVFVGRIRRDFTHPSALNLFIVADNLRKGAATNAIQIAEYYAKQFLG